MSLTIQIHVTCAVIEIMNKIINACVNTSVYETFYVWSILYMCMHYSAHAAVATVQQEDTQNSTNS